VLGIKRFDVTLPLPEYKTSGAAGLDLVSRLDVSIEPQTVGYIPLNIALELPEGYFAMIAARSSLHKKGLMLANGIGVGDYDYRGDGDEYTAALYNFTQQTVAVTKGERLVQLLILPVARVEIQEKEVLGNPNRGGFGSTG
ncbi:MAG TPA: dUTP diphosphatase, partial [Candidatus Woesebacteria bacterium]|nr:dUTP diphosphatase [Candidatus Woesebacteria bacterium]HNS65867.1 dUTP diphosphatase [Candidatus Woesebacteria bacterium]